MSLPTVLIEGSDEDLWRPRDLRIQLADGLAGAGYRVLQGGGKGDWSIHWQLDPDLPGGEEAYRMEGVNPGGGPRLLLTGGGKTGCTYGLQEIVERLEAGATREELMAIPRDEQPHCKVRSFAYYPHNGEFENDSFFRDDFWLTLFRQALRARFNQFSLVFGHQTGYLTPVYPYAVAVPGYPDTKVRGLTDAGRERNLNGLRRVIQLCRSFGIQFNLGIWQQHAAEFGVNLVDNFEPEMLKEYCPAAIKALLEACPGIEGVQFRMNSEAGISAEEQPAFFEAMVDAVLSTGQVKWLDLRAKGLQAETIERVSRKTERFTVSTKFWCEHMGLPHPATEVIREDRETPVRYRRYGYWDLLDKDRSYDFMYRLWTLGSQRLLLWGDPDYASRFARNCLWEGMYPKDDPEGQRFLGFEVMAPLSNKGFGNYPGGAWRIFQNPEDEYYRWEQERYWAFYLSFGRAGYNPGDVGEVWNRAFIGRFGPDQGPLLAEALSVASGILPLVTVCFTPSASVFSYWPELESGGLTECYSRAEVGDPGLFLRVPDFVSRCCEGELVDPRISPLEAAELLEERASRVEDLLRKLSATRSNGPARRSRGVEEVVSHQRDMMLWVALGRYHAARKRSATAFGFFLETRQSEPLRLAVDEFERALEHWRELTEIAVDTYYPNMVFNRPPWQVGHWKDELPVLEEELRRLRTLLERWEASDEDSGAIAVTEEWDQETESGWIEKPMEWESREGVLHRWPGAWAPAEPLAETTYENSVRRYAVETPKSLIDRLRVLPVLDLPEGWNRPVDAKRRPSIGLEHELVKIEPGKVMRFRVSFECEEAPESCVLRGRPVNQVAPWEEFAMKPVKKRVFEGKVPAKTLSESHGWSWHYRLTFSSGRQCYAPGILEQNPLFHWLPSRET